MTSRSALLVLAWQLLLTAAPAIVSSGGDTRLCPSPDADDSLSFCEDYHCGFRYLSKNCYCKPSTFLWTTGPSSPWLQSEPSTDPICTTFNVRSANVKFQLSFDLTPTGKCDNATRHAMLNPRCLPNEGGAGGFYSLKAPAPPSSASLGSILRGKPTSAVRQRHRRAAATAVAAAPREALKPPLHDVVSNFWAASTSSSDGSISSSEGHREEFKLPSSTNPSYVDVHPTRPAHSAFSNDVITHERSKRQTFANGTSNAMPGNGFVSFSTTKIRWRVTAYSQRMSQAEQDAAFALAFRQWCAITPLCFIHDTTSDISQIQVTIAFYEGGHSGDFRSFDGPGGELAHTLPGAFVHLDASEDWCSCITSAVGTGTCLYTVALHEIGHLIGLPHNLLTPAVMFPYYNAASQNRAPTDHDRRSAVSKYGQCNGSFDTIIDIIFSVTYMDDDGYPISDRFFSTYFFRGGYVWYYRNTLGRAYDDQPRRISEYWEGLPNSLDAICEFSSDTDDVIMAFKGSVVYLFNYTLDRAGYVYSSYQISTYFKSGALSEPIPNNIDSCYSDTRDGNMYFFKGSTVYVYEYKPRSNHSCCVRKQDIKTLFPPATADQAMVAGLTYQQNIDSVYVSIFYNTQYFFVGNHVWKNENFDYYGSDATNNSIIYMGTWNLQWGFICDVTC